MPNAPRRDAPQTPSGDSPFTGRHLLLCRPDDPALPRALRDTAGLTLATASDFTASAVDMTRAGAADGIYFDQLGVAVANAIPDQLTAATGASGVLTVERERYVYISGTPLPDYQASLATPSRASAIGLLASHLDDLICIVGANGIVGVFADLDEAARTWGLVSTRVIESTRTGRGIRIAILDTGIDLKHPDFAGRTMVTQSFIDGETAQDGNSHGTHTAGTAVGSTGAGTPPRYGIAPGAEIYVGKVLSDTGRGQDGTVLAGINWAVANRCRVISMSLGAAGRPGEQHSPVYEAAAQRALAANALLIAAAGNESRRPGVVSPVGRPANCPSVMAVAAVDSKMQIASFSCGSANADAGKIDITGPGVDVYSTTPLPERYGRLSGTSMACPHVSGVAALMLEANPGLSAKELWQRLTATAKRLDLPAEDVGAGLVQAPQ